MILTEIKKNGINKCVCVCVCVADRQWHFIQRSQLIIQAS